MARTTRTTISVPLDLKARMDAVVEPVNWSGVACSAFEQKLNEVSGRKAIETMNDVIARLRATKQGAEMSLYQEGRTAGEAWAKTQAHADALASLSDLQDTYFADWVGLFNKLDGAYSIGEFIFFRISQGFAGNRKAALDFWESITDQPGVRMKQGEYMRGFTEAAIDIWRQVRDQI